MSDLWERLKRASRISLPPSSESVSPPPPSAETAPGGWRWTAPLVAERVIEFPFDADFVRALGADFPWEDWRGTLCLDTETTGLSGGAGTVAFLVGWAEAVSGVAGAVPSVRLTQFFLRDHPGEPDLVAVLDARLGAARQWVSFNGASYDLPLLRARWAMAGREFPTVPHRDDLHPARRLWKRVLASCRLSSLEEAVLGLGREDDTSGALVPERWLAYLRAGAAADFVTPLEGVLRHHAQDVYSLLCLDLLMAALQRNPGGARWEPTFGAFPERPAAPRNAEAGLLHPDVGATTPVDFWGLTEKLDDEPREASLSDAWDETGSEAVGLAWADRLKRRRDPKARAVWTALWESRRSYPALLELLKWLEHREKIPEARREALRRIEEGLDAPFLPRSWREDLEKRQARLIMK